jgi:hypothetical protein
MQSMENPKINWFIANAGATLLKSLIRIAPVMSETRAVLIVVSAVEYPATRTFGFDLIHAHGDLNVPLSPQRRPSRNAPGVLC